jgi:hypothetical protein
MEIIPRIDFVNGSHESEAVSKESIVNDPETPTKPVTMEMIPRIDLDVIVRWNRLRLELESELESGAEIEESRLAEIEQSRTAVIAESGRVRFFKIK